MAEDVYARLKALGIVLPKAPPPAANYVPAVLDRGTLYVAGQGPVEADGTLHTGVVGAAVSLAEARSHARLTAINILAQMHAALGDLNRVERMLRVFGMVHALPDFGQQPEVIDGASALFIEVFGERGRHARCAVGLASLPRGITVEIEASAAVRDA
ncbi:MAG TPA: RidA family protein [Stellaceae bacterium]|nr:RidA family protein [Stellaceae bacterium]